MTNIWLCNTSLDNWNICVNTNIWGVESPTSGKKKEYGENQLKKVEVGDLLVFNVIKKGICGIFEVNSEVYEDTLKTWPDGTYPYRVRLKPLKILGINAAIPFKEINGKLSNKDTREVIVGNTLFGSSMIPLDTNEAKQMIINRI